MLNLAPRIDPFIPAGLLRGIILVLSLFPPLALTQNPVADQSTQVNGVVIDAISRKPLKGVTVEITASASEAKSSQPLRTTTDDLGSFTFKSVMPGAYRLTAWRLDFRQAGFSIKKSMDVVISASRNALTVELLPPASVSGRFLDENDNPVAGCSVQLHPAEAPEDLEIGDADAKASGYHLTNIPPGKYLLEANCTPLVEPPPLPADSHAAASIAYQDTFYPAGADPKTAETVELPPGSERTGLDIHLRAARFTQIHVSISAAGVDLSHAKLGLVLIPKEDFKGQTLSTPERISADKLAYDFRRVFPGSYAIAVLPVPDGQTSNRLGGVWFADVNDRPVTVAIELKPPTEVSGVIERVDGSDTKKLSQGRATVELVPDYPEFSGVDGTYMRVTAAVKEDGSFAFSPVFLGRWRIRLNGPAWLKSVWTRGIEAETGAFDLSPGTTTLKLIASTKMSTIIGVAPPGMTVGAYRQDDGPSSIRPRFASVAPNGQFQIDSLPPGRYRVAVAETRIAIPPNAGKEVSVEEGGTVAVDLGKVTE